MRRLMPGRLQRGVTLIELMVAITILGLLMVSAAPFFGDYTINSRLREAGNLVLAEALAAQSEAVKRNTTIRLSTNGGNVQVLDMTVSTSPVLLRERTLPVGAIASVSTIDFGTEGRPIPFGTAGEVNLAYTGPACSADLRCPGLRVDAGGAVRLCGNQLSCS